MDYDFYYPIMPSLIVAPSAAPVPRCVNVDPSNVTAILGIAAPRAQQLVVSSTVTETQGVSELVLSGVPVCLTGFGSKAGLLDSISEAAVDAGADVTVIKCGLLTASYLSRVMTSLPPQRPRQTTVSAGDFGDEFAPLSAPAITRVLVFADLDLAPPRLHPLLSSALSSPAVGVVCTSEVPGYPALCRYPLTFITHNTLAPYASADLPRVLTGLTGGMSVPTATLDSVLASVTPDMARALRLLCALQTAALDAGAGPHVRPDELAAAWRRHTGRPVTLAACVHLLREFVDHGLVVVTAEGLVVTVDAGVVAQIGQE